MPVVSSHAFESRYKRIVVEANMPKKGVINATQIKSINKTSIKEKIGSLSNKRMLEIYAGLNLALDLDVKEKGHKSR